MNVSSKNHKYMFMIIICGFIIIMTTSILQSYKKEKYAEQDIVIVTSHYNEDLEWLQKSTYPLVVCSKSVDSISCPKMPNKGREASSYLQYIISNYDKLPEHIAFLHGHETAWHQSNDILKMIKCAKYKTYGYISLNNNVIDDRESSNIVMILLCKHWHMFEPYLKYECPSYLYADCCAQFIVAKNKILQHPLKAYKEWYEFLMASQTDEESLHRSILFEFIWHIIFGEKPVMSKYENINRFHTECFDSGGMQK